MNLFTKAKDLGIQTEFVDGQGHRHVTDAVALKIILDALPVKGPHRFLNEAVVLRSGRPSRTELNEAATSPLRWKIASGVEVIAEGKTGDRNGDTGDRNGDTGDRTIVWPTNLPEGTYRLHLTDASSATEEAPLIVSPPKAFGGDFERSWLVAVQLYGVCSARNWAAIWFL